MRLGLSASAFDPFPHPGVQWAWRQALDLGLCDAILAVLHLDPSVDRPEKRRPAISAKDRELMLRNCRHVEAVLTYQTEAELEQIAMIHKPAVIIVGEDHRGDHVTGHEYAPVFYANRRLDWSSTAFANRIYESERSRREQPPNQSVSPPRDQGPAGALPP